MPEEVSEKFSVVTTKTKIKVTRDRKSLGYNAN
jgi:hypothetical protein